MIDDDASKNPDLAPHNSYQDADGTWWDWDADAGQYVQRPGSGAPPAVHNPIDRPAPPPPTDPTAPSTTDPGTGGSLTDPFTEPFVAPPPVDLGGPAGTPYIPPAPVFTPPGYTPPPAYHAPSPDQVLADPGYQFRVSQGQSALERSAAARGVLNTGGTLKDILDYGQNAASQEYQNVVARDLAGYDENYKSQYFDPYQFAYRGATDAFAPQMQHWATLAAAGQHQNDLNLSMAYDKWLQDYQIFRNHQNDAFDKIYRTATA